MERAFWGPYKALSAQAARYIDTPPQSPSSPRCSRPNNIAQFSAPNQAELQIKNEQQVDEISRKLELAWREESSAAPETGRKAIRSDFWDVPRSLKSLPEQAPNLTGSPSCDTSLNPKSSTKKQPWQSLSDLMRIAEEVEAGSTPKTSTLPEWPLNSNVIFEQPSFETEKSKRTNLEAEEHAAKLATCSTDLTVDVKASQGESSKSVQPETKNPLKTRRSQVEPRLYRSVTGRPRSVIRAEAGAVRNKWLIVEPVVKTGENAVETAGEKHKGSFYERNSEKKAKAREDGYEDVSLCSEEDEGWEKVANDEDWEVIEKQTHSGKNKD